MSSLGFSVVVIIGHDPLSDLILVELSIAVAVTEAVELFSFGSLPVGHATVIIVFIFFVFIILEISYICFKRNKIDYRWVS